MSSKVMEGYSAVPSAQNTCAMAKGLLNAADEIESETKAITVVSINLRGLPHRSGITCHCNSIMCGHSSRLPSVLLWVTGQFAADKSRSGSSTVCWLFCIAFATQSLVITAALAGFITIRLLHNVLVRYQDMWENWKESLRRLGPKA
ncbi:hypothetical protein AcW1_003865 [Taiwanofungus camphoratus]|nr:hypothetical protein AcW1_003865 [Antrodia cinnamomea]